ncbi:hypothetical protein [Amycolatopsis lexingtonensis]|uniref:hypothetical protein n=1 Tax=Amycolatopsis lexingtonensis TaxID=218822 RepID=UPI003F72651D
MTVYVYAELAPDEFDDPAGREATERQTRAALGLPADVEGWGSLVGGRWRVGEHPRATRYRFMVANFKDPRPVVLLADTYRDAEHYAWERGWHKSWWTFVDVERGYKLHGRTGGYYVIVGRFQRGYRSSLLDVARSRGMQRWQP